MEKDCSLKKIGHVWARFFPKIRKILTDVDSLSWQNSLNMPDFVYKVFVLLLLLNQVPSVVFQPVMN